MFISENAVNTVKLSQTVLELPSTCSYTRMGAPGITIRYAAVLNEK